MPEERHPSQPALGVASLACILSAVVFYWAAKREVSHLQIWWAECLAYAIVPLAVTFVVLYRNHWHQELTGAARTGSALLLSCAILGGELIALGITVCLALLFLGVCTFGVTALTGGNH